MSNIKSLDKLREVVRCGEAHAFSSSKAYYDAIGGCIAEIEREVSERFVELPVDAEGVPWHIGDVTENGNTVNAICLDSHGYHFSNTINDVDPSIHVHYKPRTVEDVLHDFWEEWESNPTDAEWGVRLERLRESESKYAAEIRELMGVSE